MTNPPSNTPAKTPIFLLKTKSTPHDGYEEYFSASGYYDPTFVPVLEHRFREASLRRVRDLFVSGKIGEQYGGLIFTSQRAVEGFARIIMDEVGETASTKASESLLLYSVGPATYRSLNTLRESHLPHSQLMGRDAGTGEILAHIILDHYNANHSARRRRSQRGAADDDDDDDDDCQKPTAKTTNHTKLPLLFLIGEQHRDIIPKTLMADTLPPETRIEVEELIVYETGVMESFEDMFAAALGDARARRRLEGGGSGGSGVDDDGGNSNSGERAMWVVVFSPTGCEAMLRTLGVLPGGEGEEEEEEEEKKARRIERALRDCYIATIGPTTRDHLRERYGVEPDVCAEIPSPEGVGKGIEKFLLEKRVR
ncbi:uroporphyrinogen-III synthase [Blastomyces silverae]|uniref:Uroporphyrinogen-III synthase n=1 Tax=Blastomyces silverae TaxID=2060906 RepID=A0A0H1B9Z0_9EURO|nr:uroporphyrinogen-III synthase [Blastomyces silverae]